MQPCPLCGSEENTRLKTFADGVTVGRCRACELVYTPRRHPDPTQLLANTTVEDLRAEYRLIVEGGARFYRAAIFEHYLDILERHASGSRLLDVGCAQGFFPALAKERGWEVVAVEPSRAMAAFASTELGVDVREGTLDSAELGDLIVDAVTFTDSLEYVPDPRRALQTLGERLTPDGVVLIKVPNGSYFDARHRLEQRTGLKLGGDEPFGPSLRVAHYTDRTLTRLVEGCGFAVVHRESPPPIHSPAWKRVIGVDLMIEAPWFVAPHHRLIRTVMHAAGLAEQKIARRNHLGQAVLLVARKQH